VFVHISKKIVQFLALHLYLQEKNNLSLHTKLIDINFDFDLGFDDIAEEESSKLS